MHRLDNDCSIYLVFGKKLKIPVNPEEIKLKAPGNSKEYDVLGLGQIVVPKRPKLREVSWESFFPSDRSDPYVNGGAKSPKVYADRLSAAMKAKQVGRLIIARSQLFDTNMRCIISNFELTDKGGEPGDLYYSIKLSEYRSYAPSTVSIVTALPDGQTAEAAEASEEGSRPVENPVLRVGAAVIVNGTYCYDSFGSKPHGTANNVNTTITRIVEGNPYPIHVGSRGWVREDQIEITG